MKRFILSFVLLVCSWCMLGGGTVFAGSGDDVILGGVYMGGIDDLRGKNVTFGAADDHFVAVTIGDLGISWDNEADIDAAAAIGKKGNIVKRYKEIQDLKHGNKVFDLKLSFDREALRTIFAEQCAEYDIPAHNATITRENGELIVTDGQPGKGVNVDASIDATMEYLTNEWDYSDASIDLVIDVTEPKGSAEELSKLTDVLGTYSTSYSTSSADRCKNVENGCRLINGTLYIRAMSFPHMIPLSRLRLIMGITLRVHI